MGILVMNSLRLCQTSACLPQQFVIRRPSGIKARGAEILCPTRPTRVFFLPDECIFPFRLSTDKPPKKISKCLNNLEAPVPLKEHVNKHRDSSVSSTKYPSTFRYCRKLNVRDGFTVPQQPVSFKADLHQSNQSTLHMIRVRCFPLLVFMFSKCYRICLLYTSPSPRDLSTSRMPSSA